MWKNIVKECAQNLGDNGEPWETFVAGGLEKCQIYYTIWKTQNSLYIEEYCPKHQFLFCAYSPSIHLNMYIQSTSFTKMQGKNHVVGAVTTSDSCSKQECSLCVWAFILNFLKYFSKVVLSLHSANIHCSSIKL